MEPKKDNRGGARAGAGRPKGSGNKITAQDLLDAVQKVSGRPFVESLAEGYNEAIVNGDKKIRVMYEKIIIDKVVADRQQVEVTESEETTAAKTAAFAEALNSLVNRKV